MVLVLSSPECITWLAVFVTVCAATATVNLISIILFIKNRSLRTRAMYLVISLTIADMFVGGGNNCWCLGFSYNGKCNVHNYNTIQTIFNIWSLRMAIILLFVSFSYLCFLLFHCC